MAARVPHGMGPLRSSCSPLRLLAGQVPRRSVAYTAKKTAPASSTAPKATPARLTPRAPRATPIKTASARTTATKTAPSSQAAPEADVLVEPPENVVLDPQLAAVPPPKATFAASFTPAPPEPAPNGAALSSSGSSGLATINWGDSYHGLGDKPFSAEAAAILMAPIDPEDVEVKPDGIIYLPEIKYRRILNRAFGPGGWGLAPRGEMIVGEKVVTREYALVVQGRFVAQARGECQYFGDETIPSAGEGSKSNALMRCCKDLGIASELWDPRFIRDFKARYASQIWVEHVVTKKKRQLWVRKDTDPAYPYKKSN